MRRNRGGRSPKRGRAKIIKNQKAGQVRSVQNLEGILKLHRDGYGFVLPDDPKQLDVFIPRHRIVGALSGDRVSVSFWPDPADGRLEGKVEKILQRGKRWFVGILKKVAKQYLVVTEEGKPPLEFLVDREDLFGAQLGNTVGVEVVEYPEGTNLGVGRVIQIFGARGDERTEIDIVILKHQLPTEFSAETLEEARALAENRSFEITHGRKDLRDLHFVTIDGEMARDFDDAICVKREGKNFRLWVSIADVSHYVRPESPIDRDAFVRGTSVYFPDKVLPMLPEELSNDLCSLRPFEDRLSFTAEMLFNPQGNRIENRFYKSVIQSKSRLTYRQVARAFIENQTETREKMKDSLPMLEEAFQLFRLLRVQRLKRGSIDFDLPEQEIIANLEEGGIESIVKAERTEAHMLIEEFMIAANEAVAEFITKRGHPTLYRVHGRPDVEKIKNFQLFLHNLGFRVRIPEHPDPKSLAEILKQAKGHPEARLIQYLLLRSMQQAIYSPENEGHYGLASECYTHFTSPIRRYPDLIIHRILSKALTGETLGAGTRKSELARLSPIAGHTSRRERVAMEAEWEAIKLKVALFMQKYLGETFDGVVSRIAKFGFFVELKQFFVEGLVLLEEMDDFYIFEEKHHRLRGRKTKKIIKIGREIQVVVSKVDIEERQVYFTTATP